MTLIEAVEEVLAIIGFMLSMALVAYIYSVPKQEPEQSEENQFRGMRSLEGIPNEQ